MEPVGSLRKRSRSEGFLNGNGWMPAEADSWRFNTGGSTLYGDSNRFKSTSAIATPLEKESIPTGLGSKSKTCTKFFSTSGCPYGEGCHFLHYFPGGTNAVSQMPIVGGTLDVTSRKPIGPTTSRFSSDHSGPVPTFKTRICNNYGSAEGCRFGDKCHFAHGERELKSEIVPARDLESERLAAPYGTRLAPAVELDGRPRGRPPYHEPAPPGMAAAATFGASSTAKISIDASLAGGIIGKGGVNSKQICRLTGVKLLIKEHESDPNLKNIELEGSFDQINQATVLVRDLIKRNDILPAKPPVQVPRNRKTKLCENYAQGTCTFGESCHFAHGASELREPSARA